MFTVPTTVRRDIGFGKVNWEGTWFPDVTIGPTSASLSDIKVGGSVPQWKSKIRSSTNATGTYSRTVTNDALARGSASFSVKNPNQGFTRQKCTLNGVLIPAAIVASPTPANTEDSAARIKFLQKVRSTTRSFQSGVFLGELAEAIHMVRHPAQALRQAVSTYYRDVKRISRGAASAKAVSKAVSGTWLEHSYGWRPLFKDVDDGMKALAHIPRIIGETVSGTSSKTWNDNSNTSHIFENARINTRWVNRFSVLVLYKGLVAYENSSSASSWSQNWGATLSDFVPTVYELIPYSFLVDYFSNLGSVLDTSSMGTVNLRWGFCSTKLSSSREVARSDVVNFGYPVGQGWDFKPGACKMAVDNCTRMAFSRTSVATVSVGLSDLDVKVPGVGNWRQWANLAALAAERVLS